MHKSASIIGAGLAGSEAALKLAQNGYSVKIYDAKPKLLDAYKLSTAAELVCNNSFGELDASTARGMLIKELIEEGSLLIQIARKCSVNDGKHFGIDVSSFSASVNNALIEHGVEFISGELFDIPNDRPLLIASGPLTNDALAKSISETFKINHSRFSDATCPIVDITSINLKNQCIRKKNDDLYEIIVDDELLLSFHASLLKGTFPPHSHVDERSFKFEKIYTLEALAKQGYNKLLNSRFRLGNNQNGLLLRRESILADGFILARCTTMLDNRSQKKSFSLLPGFSNVRFIRYGRMHRNTYFHSPGNLDCFYKIKNEDIFLIGQIAGIDGYTEAISSGLVAAQRIIKGASLRPYPASSMMGALANYISSTNVTNFQPMGATLNLLPLK